MCSNYLIIAEMRDGRYIHNQKNTRGHGLVAPGVFALIWVLPANELRISLVLLIQNGPARL